MKKLLSFLTLFTSVSTLVCCALPALLVSLGMGATLASVVSTVPQLVWISEQKGLVFGAAGVLLCTSAALMFRNRAASCPADRELAAACMWSRGWGRKVFLFSAALYCVGVFFAFIAPTLYPY